MITQQFNLNNIRREITSEEMASLSFLSVLFQYTSFQAIYDEIIEALKRHTLPFLIMPCCQAVATESYILYGHYKRTVIDLIGNIDKKGVQTYSLQTITNFEIQRIMCKNCEEHGKTTTHAILMHLLIPYSQYSLRAVLYYLYLYYSDRKHRSIEDFCKDYDLRTSTFKSWLRWLRENGPLLEQIGNALHKEGKANLRDFLDRILGSIEVYFKKSIDILSRTLLQTHRSPANSLHLSGEPIYK